MPAARMFRAAFTSRSWAVPQPTQARSLIRKPALPVVVLAGLDIALRSLLGYCALIAVQDFSVTFSSSLLIPLLMRVIKALARWRWRA